MGIPRRLDTKIPEKELYAELRKLLGKAFREQTGHKESRILEGHLIVDCIHTLVEIPPTYSAAQVAGYSKGKSAIQIARRFEGGQKNFSGEHLRARGYYISTAGLDEKEYVSISEIKKMKVNDRIS